MQLFSQRMTTTEAGGITCMSIPVPGSDAVTIIGSFPAGKMYGTDINPFCAHMTTRMLEEGTENRTKDELSESLEAKGADVSFESDILHVRFTIQCLKDDMRDVLDIVADMLEKPRFSEDAFEHMKKRVVAELTAESDDPGAVGKRALTRALYPKNHPLYLSTHTEAIRSIKAISLDDVKTFHATYYGRGALKIACVGNITSDKVSGLVHEIFARLPERIITTLVIPEALDRFGEVSIPMPGKESALFLVGAPLALGPWDEEYDALKFGLDILGGGAFANRLMGEVREKKGLTYSTRVRVDGYDGRIKGYWYAYGFFPPRSLKEGKKAILEEIEKLVNDEGITLIESEEKKIELTGRFPVMFDRRETFAALALKASEQGLPDTYWDEYTDRINNLTRKEVNDALVKHIQPKHLGIGCAGDIKKKKAQRERKTNKKQKTINCKR